MGDRKFNYRCGVRVIKVGKGHGELRSNARGDCLYFTLLEYL